MRAILRTSYGSADILEMKEVAKPSPADGQLLIRVYAASVNPIDWHVLRGEPFLVRLMGFGLLKPKHQIIGADMAGRVEAVGNNVTLFKVGDEVFGASMGGFAEHACIREDRVVLKPAAISFEEAAAVPIAGITALQALRDRGRLQSGQRILINGASGGVGTFAVQIAKAMGAEVTAVCSTGNIAMVRSIGADHVIDYTQTAYWESGDKYDLIVDNAAFYPVSKPLRVMKPKGRYVLVGGRISTAGMIQSLLFHPLVSRMTGKKILTLMANINRPDLAVLGEYLARRAIVPVIDRKYSLAECPEAIRYLETGHARGKVIIAG